MILTPLKMWAQYLTNVLNIYMDDQLNEKQNRLNKLNQIVTNWHNLLPSSHLVEGLHGAFHVYLTETVIVQTTFIFHLYTF
ncbi:hypothetical protein [Enterococcus lactis]|uniref:hypothetical protein n=1 Tax=Enterococcus lactis TaxID=357441 RepID=UPI002412AA57|nr:hypothetical protein [Enterococcus lactis]